MEPWRMKKIHRSKRRSAARRRKVCFCVRQAVYSRAAHASTGMVEPRDSVALCAERVVFGADHVAELRDSVADCVAVGADLLANSAGAVDREVDAKTLSHSFQMVSHSLQRTEGTPNMLRGGGKRALEETSGTTHDENEIGVDLGSSDSEHAKTAHIGRGLCVMETSYLWQISNWAM